MTKQDEVRKEVFATLADSQRLPLRECGETADKILEGISKLGVVIKIDRELPEWLRFKWAKNSCCNSQEDVEEQFTFDIVEDAGYGVFESLIKDK